MNIDQVILAVLGLVALAWAVLLGRAPRTPDPPQKPAEVEPHNPEPRNAETKVDAARTDDDARRLRLKLAALRLRAGMRRSGGGVRTPSGGDGPDEGSGDR